MPNPPLRVEREPDGVVILTLALPERRNAMTAELTAAWGDAIAALRGDRDVRVVVVTGEGSAFCAGGDLSWIGESPDLTVDAIRDRMLPFYRVWLSIRELEVPTIAAVNGPAIGAGLCIALACDLRYAAAGAVLSPGGIRSNRRLYRHCRQGPGRGASACRRQVPDRSGP